MLVYSITGKFPSHIVKLPAELSSQDFHCACHCWAWFFEQDLQRLYYVWSCSFCLGRIPRHWSSPVRCCIRFRYKNIPYSSSNPFTTPYPPTPSSSILYSHALHPKQWPYPHEHSETRCISLRCISLCCISLHSKALHINTKCYEWGGTPSWQWWLLGCAHGLRSWRSPRTVSSYSCIFHHVNLISQILVKLVKRHSGSLLTLHFFVRTAVRKQTKSLWKVTWDIV